MCLQRSIKSLQQTIQQDLEEMSSKRERKGPPQQSGDHQPFTVCLGLLLKSAEVSLLLKPVPQPEGSGSPLGSELSPSESQGTLDPGLEKDSEGFGSGAEGGAAKGSCTVDQLLCGAGLISGSTHVPAPLSPNLSSNTHLDANQRGSVEERTKNSGRWSSDDGGEVGVDGVAGGEATSGLDLKPQTSDPLPTEVLGNKDPTKTPQSISRYYSHKRYSGGYRWVDFCWLIYASACCLVSIIGYQFGFGCSCSHKADYL